MNKHHRETYSLSVVAIAMIILVPSAHAEVIDLQTTSNSFLKGDDITFNGKVEPGSSGLVTIVIRDSNDEFVLLTQAITDENYKFEKTITVNEKFRQHGIYNATGFIMNMTAGVTTSFGVSTNGTPIVFDQQETITEDTVSEEAPIEEAPIEEAPVKIDFVDSAKDPQYYIDRYYNEPKYKSWFDRNYPGITIEDAVGYVPPTQKSESSDIQIMKNQIVPDAEAASLVEPANAEKNKGETAQIVLAIGGLGILFGAVYGIKRKVDDNSKQISINKDSIRKRILNPLFGSNPSEIIQARLAKGEISLEEFDELEKRLG